MPKLPAKAQYTPKNPKKYIGGNRDKIVSRSSWEWSMMLYFDNHPNVIAWANETLPTNHAHKGLSGISYMNPLTGKWTFYVPDFFVIYNDKNGKQHAELIEVKPLDEVPPMISGFTGRVSQMKKGRQIVNAAKFEAAIKYCARWGFTFRICTEKDMFAFTLPSQRK